MSRILWIPNGYLAMVSAGEAFVFRGLQVLILVRKDTTLWTEGSGKSLDAFHCGQLNLARYAVLVLLTGRLKN